jgi:hypothetical protein
MTLPPHSPSSSNLFPPTITPYGARPTDRPSKRATDHQVLWLKRSPLCCCSFALAARINNSASVEAKKKIKKCPCGAPNRIRLRMREKWHKNSGRFRRRACFSNRNALCLLSCVCVRENEMPESCIHLLCESREESYARTITMRNKVARLYSGRNLFFLSFHFA